MRRFLVALDIFRRRGPRLARFVAARGMFPVTAMRFVMARAARRRRLLARRLDAAERAAQLLDLTLVGELLALGDLDEFKHLVKLVNHLLERFGNLGGVRDGLVDGRGFGGTKIGGFDPRLGPRRFRAAFLPLVAGRKFAGLRGRRANSGRFGRGFFGRHRLFNCGGFRRFLEMLFGMRLAEIAGGVAFRFRAVGVDGGFIRRFRFRRGKVRRDFGGDGGSFCGRGARAAATTSATATAASGGAARGGGQV
jgi:hypothetical protein